MGTALSHTSSAAARPARTAARTSGRVAIAIGALAVLGLILWQAITSAGAPDPATAASRPGATLDIAVLVFREGLECILVLSAITAGMNGSQSRYRAPIGWGVVGASIATIATWFIAARAIGALSESIPALHIQAATGLLAVIVLLVVMNWFFHRVYWTGWISMHNRRKRSLLGDSADEDDSAKARRRVFLGLAALGFTSLYREGFEVVLFLQSYRLKLGSDVVYGGVAIGATLAAMVAVITFIARRKLPYKQMLVATGIMLGAVLLVMVGEQAQEMQLAHWIPTTTIHALDGRIPAWTGLWFSVFPTVETLAAQLLAGVLVIGSYFLARPRS